MCIKERRNEVWKSDGKHRGRDRSWGREIVRGREERERIKTNKTKKLWKSWKYVRMKFERGAKIGRKRVSNIGAEDWVRNIKIEKEEKRMNKKVKKK